MARLTSLLVHSGGEHEAGVSLSRLRSAGLWAVLFVVVWFASPRVLMALGCMTNANGVVGVGTLDNSTGIRTIKVTLPSDSTHDYAQAAINAWNAQTSTTKITFQGVSSGGDIAINHDSAAVSNANSFCASSGPGNDVSYDDTIKTLADDPNSTTGGRTNSAIVTRVFTHELGHVLNLTQADTTANSIMAGASGGSNCLDAVTNYPATHSDSGITGDDASSANTCANKGPKVKDPDAGYGANQPSGDCFDVYWVTIWYTENEDGSWNVIAAEWDYLYSTCDHPPPY